MSHSAKAILINKILSTNDNNLLDSIASVIAEHERGRYWIVERKQRNHYQVFYIRLGLKTYLGSKETKQQAQLLCDEHEKSIITETLASCIQTLQH